MRFATAVWTDLRVMREHPILGTVAMYMMQHMLVPLPMSTTSCDHFQDEYSVFFDRMGKSTVRQYSESLSFFLSRDF